VSITNPEKGFLNNTLILWPLTNSANLVNRQIKENGTSFLQEIETNAKAIATKERISNYHEKGFVYV
jgi:hypothetical protein